MFFEFFRNLYGFLCQMIDEHTDISYQVGKEGGGGIVSSRDFVVLRHWGMKDGCYVSAGVSVSHPTVPPVKKYVRYMKTCCLYLLLFLIFSVTCLLVGHSDIVGI